jgi:predicted lipase
VLLIPLLPGSDLTSAGCATCFQHKELTQNVCEWCLLDQQCHDVGSLESDCAGPQGNDQCISIAVKTKCTIHAVSSCPAPPPADPFEEARAKTFLYFSGAAYCDATMIQNWTNCKACQLADPTFTPKVITSSKTSTQVFVGRTNGESSENIVVAFRGSQDLLNWISNLDFAKMSAYPKCKGCKVHNGFYRAWESVMGEVVSEVKRLVALQPKAQVFVTGHSLGAALAVLCAAELGASAQSLGFPIEAVYTFGEPRVGNDKFRDFYNTGAKVTWRLTHRHDPVPHLPLYKMGFRHMATEVFYPTDDSLGYHICDGSGEDPKCSNRNKLDLDVADHLHYLGVEVADQC